MQENTFGNKLRTNSASYYDHSRLTAEIIDSAISDVFSDRKNGKNFPPYGYIGGGLYHIGNGAYCNKNGFDEFEESFYDAIRVATSGTSNIEFRKLSKTEIAKIKKLHGSK